MAPRRVAVTGLGIVSPLGIGVDENWRRLCAGDSGIGLITRFDTTDFAAKIAGEVKDFDATRWLAKRELRQMDVFIQYAIACAAEAVGQAGLDKEPPVAERYGVYVGAGLGGITTIEATIHSLREKGPRHGISPYFVPALIINLAGGQISIRYGCKGPNMGHVSACATGSHAIGEAARVIAYGEADVMIAGGTESTVTPVSIGGFASARALSTRNDEPQKASRPFTASRDGFVLSEGAALLTLEAWEHAKARGAPILAELVGYGRNADAHHITLPSPDGEGAQRCMRLALGDAGLAPEAIGYINAHGTSTAADSIETKAIRAVFGKHADQGLAVSSTKSMTGHLLGAAGSLEAAISVLALGHGILPPTINLD
ncbi:MAG: beta-ketoacyl-ACP synthase II, partial [Myxococcales bacterium]|nr:beta-ketoacyl-ACP synthase II [Myxococcales bacterium]